MEKLIYYKKGSSPFYSSGTAIRTDMDTFPYPRYYRGIPESGTPIVMDREAGWAPRHDKCYKIPVTADSHSYYPNHCFQGAPSTIYPCYPEYIRKYSDKKELDSQLFRKSVLEYR